MADVTNVFSDITGEKSFYTAEKKEKKEFVPIVPGEYLCHIIDVKTSIRDVKGKYKGRVYNYTVQVAAENSTNKYTYQEINGDDKETDGSTYKGYKFRGSVWRFLEPQEEDKFEANPTGNKGYYYFCEAIGVDCPRETKTINGKEVEVQTLPNLTSNDLIGKPVIAVVGEGRPWKDKDGNKKTFWDCKFVKRWEDGKEKSDASSEEIPF
jgi:hypothetical protein